MAITPQTPRRGARTDTDITGNDERDTLNTMQEPLGSMDRPVSGTSDINEVNLPPGETVRRTGNLGRSNTPGASTSSDVSNRGGRSFTATFAIAAIVLLAAFLIAIYLGSNRSDVATTTGTTQAPVADSTTGTTNGTTPNDTTGSTTVAPSQQTAPGTSDAGDTTTGGGTAPANP